MIDDCLTRSAYKGLAMQQRAEAMDFFKILLNNNNFNKIIEIGTGCGGLTQFLRDLLPVEKDLYSFDVYERDYYNNLRNNNIKLYKEDIFKLIVDWSNFEVKDEWVNMFNETPKLVLCDGGYKIGEFNGLSKHLSPGDIIMLHDYSTDRKTFEELNVWNWLECQYQDIKIACESNNLQPYMQEEFLSVAWGCFIKK
jgi:hypothetical protein